MRQGLGPVEDRELDGGLRDQTLDEQNGYYGLVGINRDEMSGV